jgi:prephenate dehydrogenase/chorismate mutase
MATKSSDNLSRSHFKQIENELGHTRAKISEVTLAIVEAVKKRQELSNIVARIKEDSGVPIENLNVEKKLKARIAAHARKIGLESKLALKIADILIESSKVEQRKVMFSKRIRAFLTKNKINSVSIVGAGRMGGWFAHYFKNLKLDVLLYDQKSILAKNMARELDCDCITNYRSALNSDIILVAVPISRTRTEIRNIQRLTEKRRSRVRAIFEISSVKGTISERAFESNANLSVVSIHPLFGPSADEFSQNTIAFVKRKLSTSKGSRVALQLVQGIFPQYNIVQVDAIEHDREMALKLSLPHALALVFAKVLSRHGTIWRDTRMGTTSFDALKDISGKVLSENPDVYFEIQTSNKYTLAVLNDLESAIREFKEIVELKDRSGFKRLFDLSI